MPSSSNIPSLIAFTALATIASSLIVGVAHAQTRPADEAPDVTIRIVRDASAGQTSPIATAMFSAGVRNCATRVDQVGSFLTKGTKSTAMVFLPEKEPDNSMLSVSMEVVGEGIPRAYASATFSPNTAIGCAAEYETVQYWPEPCNAVAQKQFRGATSPAVLGTDISVLTIGPVARVFLMRATATSCISIKKELLR